MTVSVDKANNLVDVSGGSYELTIVEQPENRVSISGDTLNEISIQEQPSNNVLITVIETELEVSETTTFLTIIEGTGGTGTSGPPSNYSATTDPTVNDDSGDGYEVGSIWVNVDTDEPFILVDATVGAAVWQSMLGGGSTDYVDIAARDSSNDDLVYAGRTNTVGAPTSSAVWQIYRLTASTETKVFADGDSNYDNIWDDRESLTYS